MKKTKVVLSIIMALLMSLNINGCGAASKDEVAISEKNTITIAARSGSHSDVINAVISDFETENNCTVKVVSFGS